MDFFIISNVYHFKKPITITTTRTKKIRPRKLTSFYVVSGVGSFGPNDPRRKIRANIIFLNHGYSLISTNFFTT